jgi:hypothetical protein
MATPPAKDHAKPYPKTAAYATWIVQAKANGWDYPTTFANYLAANPGVAASQAFEDGIALGRTF